MWNLFNSNKQLKWDVCSVPLGPKTHRLFMNSNSDCAFSVWHNRVQLRWFCLYKNENHSSSALHHSRGKAMQSLSSHQDKDHSEFNMPSSGNKVKLQLSSKNYNQIKNICSKDVWGGKGDEGQPSRAAKDAVPLGGHLKRRNNNQLSYLWGKTANFLTSVTHQSICQSNVNQV